ncbi:MAG TPA: nucleoside hydrolase [Anaerolineaceae bacterium]|nr:nucleoside hydrolase [Anaerolineaceae bacterium]
MTNKIIIDTDPGIDDALAICMAIHSPEISILGITSVFGNTYGKITAQNALRLSELSEHQVIPVARGSDIPLVMPIQNLGTIVHGEDGMGDSDLPSPRKELSSQSAVELIAKIIRENPGEITLLTLGPLTNIALALRVYPELIGQIKKLVIMGGVVSRPGNMTPVSEANMGRDPHAAEIVFAAELPTVLVGLDVTEKTIITNSLLDEIFAVKNPTTRLLKKIIPAYQHFFKEYYCMDGSFYAHDPSAMAYVLKPDLFQTRKAPIFVETEGRCLGQTIADWDHKWDKRTEVEVCLEVDSQGVLDTIKASLIS